MQDLVAARPDAGCVTALLVGRHEAPKFLGARLTRRRGDGVPYLDQLNGLPITKPAFHAGRVNFELGRE